MASQLVIVRRVRSLEELVVGRVYKVEDPVDRKPLYDGRPFKVLSPPFLADWKDRYSLSIVVQNVDVIEGEFPQAASIEDLGFSTLDWIESDTFCFLVE